MYYIDGKHVTFAEYTEYLRRHWSDEDLQLTLTDEKGKAFATVPAIEAQELVAA